MYSSNALVWRALLLCCLTLPVQAQQNVSEPPSGVPYITPRSAQADVDPRSMIVMSNDHQLFFKAYTDWSDLDGDGDIDTVYKNSIEYYGYFDSGSCYDYDSSLEGGAFRFSESAKTDFSCPSSSYWSGNFLNWASMTRMDILRKVLYGGKRKRDTATETTILERAYLPYDAHSFTKLVTNSTIINNNTPFNGERAITLCNTTGYTGTGQSKNIDKPPLLRVARGEYPNWASNSGWQCTWRGDRDGATVYQNKRPDEANDGLRKKNYNVHVEVCAHTGPGCKQYSSAFKPVGLLHEYADSIEFGLMSGSYQKNTAGGVLRANLRSFKDEIDPDTGEFRDNVPGIVSNIDAFRLSRYSYSDGTYNNDNCPFGKKLKDVGNGDCSSWGNPLAEVTEEALRYLSGEGAASNAYKVGISDRADDYVEDNFVKGLTSPEWQNNIETAWCAAHSMILINSSEVSFDGTGASAHSNDLGKLELQGGRSIASWTDQVGSEEKLGGKYFIGETASENTSKSSNSTNGKLCTPKEIGKLSDVQGICPGAPGLEGSYHVAGLAKYAHETSIIVNPNDETQGKSIDTYAVRLTTNTPIIDLGKVKIVPACENTRDNGKCAIVDFRSKTIDENSGSFDITWEVAEFGGDYDSDIEVEFEYTLEDDELSIITNVTDESSGRPAGLGYILSGAEGRYLESGELAPADGFIAHSGIKGYNRSLCIGGCNGNDGKSTQRYFVSGTDGTASLKPPLYYAAKYGKGTPEDPPGNYFEVNRIDKLVEALRDVFEQVSLSTKTGAGLGYSKNVEGRVFQTTYNNLNGWSGDLLAYKTTSAGVANTPLWEAQKKLPKSIDRTIITRTTSGGVAFTSAQVSEALTQEQIMQLRAQPLGDMVGSRPVAVGVPDTYYVPTGPEDTSYANFKNKHLSRTPMVYVGANDGMLHGFDAGTGTDGGVNGGVEKLAYVPGMLLDTLGELTKPSYQHRYFVDGSPLVLDARINSEWRSVLASGLGFGGRGVFALDVTQPDQFAERKADEIALFEYSPALEQTLFGKESINQHLGYIQGKPSLVQRESGSFFLVFGNGYFSPSGRAVLYLVDLNGAEDGVIESKDVQRIVVPDGSLNNGLSAVSLVDTDNNGRVDTAYGGDLQGNLWRFDLAGDEVKKLFTAQRTIEQDEEDETSDSDRQMKIVNLPITTGVEVGRHRDGDQMLFFGTGAAPDLPLDDTSRGALGAFYAIKDTLNFDARAADISINDLANRMLTTDTRVDKNQKRIDLRFFENSAPLGNKKGWYMEFPEGERVVSDALLYEGRILFNTLIPGQGYCGAEDKGFDYDFSAFEGLPTQTSAFDLNGDRMLDGQDTLNDKVAVGMRSEGAAFTPVIDTHPKDNVANRLNVNTNGKISTRYGANLLRPGRVSWRLLEN